MMFSGGDKDQIKECNSSSSSSSFPSSSSSSGIKSVYNFDRLNGVMHL